MTTKPLPITPASHGETPGIAEGGSEDWRKLLAPYMKPRVDRALGNLATSLGAYLVLVVAMCFALQVSDWLVLALSIPAAGFLIRTFIVFHDCAHGSFLPSKRANALLGASLGPLLYMPFACWRHEHAVHHATAGDLDRRGVGDIKTLTVEEYRAESRLGRLAYRLFRNPLVMFGLGPLWVILVGPRLVPRGANKRIRRSVLGTNAAILAIAILGCLVLGWQGFLLVELPVIFLTGSAGIWLFYVQHQFEDTYWQPAETWSYDDAALKGSSYLKLPTVLRFFTGNIGLHHVHHLSARIPNYNLVAAHAMVAERETVPTLTLREAAHAVRLKLWDERNGRLVTFRQARLVGEPARPLGGPAPADVG